MLLGTDAEYSHLASVLPRGLWLLSYGFHISDSGKSCVGFIVGFGCECGCQ